MNVFDYKYFIYWMNKIFMSDLSLEDRIILILLESNDLLSPSEISLRAGFHRPNNKAKNVNPILYKLLKEGKVIKYSNQNGSDPRWKLDTQIFQPTQIIN
jgi:hypothetical protein